MEKEKAVEDSYREASLLDLPDEVIQYILRLLPPYNDLKTCMLVCKRLYTNVQSVVNYSNLSLNRAISEFDIEWRHMDLLEETGNTITRRYSHSACFHDDNMYIFGGCTFSSTTFNDLWRLDLSTRKWNRLLTSGHYPSPKACASIVAYKFCLVLYGGLTQPSTNFLHQTWRVFNELHVYNINNHNWTAITNLVTPPALAGHSATVHGNVMVIFGGLLENNVSSNDVWCLNLDTFEWHQQATSDLKPRPRYGASQIYIDDCHLLILGGCGGVHSVFNDAWLLTMSEPVYVWKQVTIRNKQYAAPHIFCHPAVRVNSRYVVTVSQNPNAKYISGCLFSRLTPGLNIPLGESNMSNNSIRLRQEGRTNGTDETRRREREATVAASVNARCSGRFPPSSSSAGSPSVDNLLPNSNARAQLFHQKHVPVPKETRMFAFRCPNSSSSSPPPSSAHSSIQRERQLATLRRMQNYLSRQQSLSSSESTTGAGAHKGHHTSSSARSPPPPTTSSLPVRPVTAPPLPPSSPPQISKMALFVLDISELLSETDSFIVWKVIKNVAQNSPAPTILYSLVLGKGELIMFGGMYKDMMSSMQEATLDTCEMNYNSVSNLVHFITVPTLVI